MSGRHQPEKESRGKIKESAKTRRDFLRASAIVATKLRAFGEEYHEKKLEEAFIFPAVKKAGGEAATYPDILVAQHNRGREITDYIISVTQGAKFGATNGSQWQSSWKHLC